MGFFDILKHKDKDKKTEKKDQEILDSPQKQAKPISIKVKKDKKKKEVKNSSDLTVAEIKEDKNLKDKKKGKFSKSKVNKKDTKDAHKVLIRALITEKASYLKAENKYLFEVSERANKNEIKKAIYHVYGTWPIKVNVSNLSGKNRRYGQNTGVTKSRKKAIVTLKKGDSIELYEGV